jgi:hypothetical protein
MLKTVLSIALFSSLIFPQDNDSLFLQNDKSVSDTMVVSITDTALTSDTTKTTKIAEKDTLIPLQSEPLTDVSAIINKKTFLFENYRYTGDLLRSFSLNFVKDLGFIGYPHETFIYGVGNSGISYLKDGLFINNRFTNSLDLNFVQSEDIDSIEIIPSPRGFLYGAYNNPVTVNFITRDFIPSAPYTRIKYYEGPDGEAMIDGKFNAMVANRWNLSFQATNRIVDETYSNTEFSIWQANAKLKYFLSNSVNITGSYYFVGSNQGLNGGVDYDSLTQISDNPASDLYEPFVAPVVYPNRKLDVTQHNFRLRTLAKPFDDSKLDLSVYYRYGLDEYRNVRDSLDFGLDHTSKSFGALVNYLQNVGIFTFQLLGDYESLSNKLFWRSDNFTNSGNFSRFSFGGILTATFLEKYIQTSLYYKQNHFDELDYWDEKEISLNGLGADIILRPGDIQSIYIGYSLRESRSNDEYIPGFELGTRLNYSGLLFDFKYFHNEHFYESSLEVYPPWFYIQKARGLGLILNYKFSFFLLETNTSYYFEVDEERPVNLPNWQFVGGLYVNDMFFDDNLDLKAGFKFYYKGKTDFAFDYFGGGGSVDPTNKIDFTLAGEIRGAAIFYFIWENLLGNQYYITPYYPMPERNIRFGLAWELFN